MDFKEIINRINYLYHKSQNEGLSEEEKDEQKKLKQEYLETFRKNFRAQLETIKKAPKDEYKN